ncbi:hypothetical protein [Flavobacterium pedocola]
MTNNDITNHLRNLKYQCYSDFESTENVDDFFKKIFDQLKDYDFDKYKKKLKQEILDGIQYSLKHSTDDPRKLNAIHFEYGSFYHEKDTQANPYGIITDEPIEIELGQIDFGETYEVVYDYYGPNPITLSFYDNLEQLDYDNLPEEYQETLEDEGEYGIDGYIEVDNAYTFAGYYAVHEVLLELDNEGAFEIINYDKGFIFTIGLHDDAQYLLLIK